jgi:hypothetical protein
LSGCTAKRKNIWPLISGVARIEGADAPLFQTLDKAHKLSGEAISRRDMLRVVEQRCNAAALAETFCNHTSRGTGITVFLV